MSASRRGNGVPLETAYPAALFERVVPDDAQERDAGLPSPDVTLRDRARRQPRTRDPGAIVWLKKTVRGAVAPRGTPPGGSRSISSFHDGRPAGTAPSGNLSEGGSAHPSPWAFTTNDFRDPTVVAAVPARPRRRRRQLGRPEVPVLRERRASTHGWSVMRDAPSMSTHSATSHIPPLVLTPFRCRDEKPPTSEPTLGPCYRFSVNSARMFAQDVDRHRIRPRVRSPPVSSGHREVEGPVCWSMPERSLRHELALVGEKKNQRGGALPERCSRFSLAADPVKPVADVVVWRSLSRFP
jgi:hypothetical protein